MSGKTRWPRLGPILPVLLLLARPAVADDEPTRVVDGFRIYVEAARASAYDDLWEALPGLVERIRGDLGAGVLRHGEIHVVADINRFFSERGEATRAPRWAKAIAVPSRRLIVLSVPDPDLRATLTHELSHLAVHEAAGGHHVPRWFLEGFAMLQAEEWGIARSYTIGQAALLGNTIPFADLDRSFPPHSLSAGLAYAQSFHFVRRLLEEEGPGRVQAWLEGVAGGEPWQQSFETAFGVTPAAAFEAWRDSVRVWYGWIPAIISVTTMWTGLSVLALWAFRRVRRRRRQRLAAMEAAERELYPPDPDDELFS